MSYTPPNPNGQATSANSAPVVIASDQSAIPVSDGGASLTVDAASLPLPVGAATSTQQSDGSQKTQIVDGSGNVIGSTANALNVNITSGGSSNTQYAEGATTATATGTLALGKNGTTLKATQTDSAGNLRVDLSQTSANATAIKVDGSAVTQPTNITQIAGGTAITSGVTGALAAGGDTANAATDAGNPLKIGGVGRTTTPTAVTDGQRVNATFDKVGRQVVVGSVRDLKGAQQTTITNSTAETTIITAVAATFCDMYGLVLTNSSGAATKVTIKDATAGTTRFVFQVPATETRGFMLPESAAHNQSAVNNNWTATCTTAVTSLEITALFIKNT